MRTPKNKHVILLLMLLFTLLFTKLTWADNSNISFKAKPEGDIRIYGNSIVWMSYSSGNWDVYHMDKSTGEETQITDDPNTQGYPDVWHNYIVWQDNREHKPNGSGDFDIYLYDITNMQERKISTIEGNHQGPIISDNKVVWVDNKDGEKNIMLYDIQSETINQVSSKDANAFGVAFDGQVIAWMDARDGDFDIYMYDTAKKVEKQLTYGLGDELDPLVCDGKVVWMVAHNGASQVYMYDVKNDYITKLTVENENHRPIAFSGNSLLITQGSRLILNNVDNITDQAINSPEGTIPKQAFLSGGEVVWYDGRTVTAEEVTDAVNRVPVAENKPEEPSAPTQISKNTESKKEKESDKKEEINSRRLIKAEEDTVITSEDGRMTIKILKGSFEKDEYITIYKDNTFKADGYLPLTPVYGWNIEGNAKLQKPIELSITYKDIAINDNPKKICLYEIEENRAPKPITLRIDRKTNTLTAGVKGSGKAALMIYWKKFNDIEKHWAYDIVETIAAHQIINGYTDGSFKPDKEMSRAEFIKILISSLHIEETEAQVDAKSAFQDVADGYWAYKYINTAYEKGWISGFDGRFNPNSPITREQTVSILMRVYNDISKNNGNQAADKVGLSCYTDKDEISQWALDSMEKAVELGVISGNNGMLSPRKNATRAEAAAMLYRYLEKLSKL